VSDTIKEDEGDMDKVRSTSRIEEVEDSYGNNEEKELKSESEVRFFVQAYLSQREIAVITL